jgi:tetratricopeptide (TPR) repeat protein
MSLLLDALKKAAEQKAEKSRNADASKQAPEQSVASESISPSVSGSADSIDPNDTELDPLGVEETQGQAADAVVTNDDTELARGDFDSTQIKLPADENRENVDDTHIQPPKSGITQFDPSEVAQSDSDDTQAAKYASPDKALGEDTELSDVIPVETEDVQFDDRQPVGTDDTGLTEAGPVESEDLLVAGRSPESGEETDISVADISGFFEEDETIILTDDDVSKLMAGDEPESEQSKLPEHSQPVEQGSTVTAVVEGDTDVRVDDKQSGEDESDDYSADENSREDYSVSLFDGDYTDPKAETDDSELSLVDQTSTQNSDASDYSISLFEEDVTPLAPGVQNSGYSTQDDNDEGLSLADKTGLRSLTLIDVEDSNPQDDDFTRSDITQPSQFTTDIDPPSKTLTRMDATSTQTYAADNYDRTLQRSDAKEGSNSFTGMKSESGDVLTAEHAKKVFHSKSSSRRIENAKAYSVTVVVILAIFIGLGIFRLEEDNEKIENSLRPLKRDPMPGFIKNVTDQGFTDVFATTAGSEVDARALELVENAEVIVGAEDVVVEIGADGTGVTENTETAQITELPQNQSDSTVGDEAQPMVAASSESVIEGNLNNSVSKLSEVESPGILQISSKNTVTEKDRLLREAYVAYQQGDDKVALFKYNLVLDLDSGSRNALLARAAINFQNGNFEAAIQDYRTLLLANPKDSLAMSSLTAIANYSPGKAESLLKLMIRDEPNSPYLNFALGNVYGAQNRWPEAQGQYFTALENNPGNPNYAYNLAVSLEHISQPSVAISYYQRALDNFNNGLATFNRDVVDQRLEMLRQL